MRGPTALTVLLAGLTAAGGPARANGPVFLDDGPQRGGLQVERLAGWVELGLRGTHTRSGDFALDETLLAPGLHLDAAGNVVHPDLLTFRSAGTLRYNRRWLTPDSGQADDLTFSDFDLGLGLLPAKTVHLGLFGRRNSGWHTSPYRSSTRTENTAWGAEASADWRRLPTTLTWSREEFFENQEPASRTTRRQRLRLGSRWRGEALRATLVLRHENFRQDRQPQDYDTDGATLEGNWRAARPLTVTGGGRWLHRRGSQRHLDADLHGAAVFRPRRNLDGRLELRHRRLRPGGPEAPLTRAGSGRLALRHLLYGSLETAVNLHLLDENTTADDLETATLSRRTAELRLGYTRGTRWGRLHLGARRSLGRQERTALTAERAVANEEHVLSDGVETPLEQPAVVAGSVVVSDATGFVVYLEGIDYSLDAVGDLTVIRRLPAGDIPDGATVRVDYRYRISPDLAFDILVRAWSVRFDARGDWSLWAERQDTDQRRISGLPDAGLEDRSRRAVGGRWTPGRLTIEDEYEVQVVPGTRFRSNRLRADTRLAAGSRWRLAGGAAHTWTRSDAPRRTHRYLQFHLRAALAASRRTTARLEAWARFDRESGGTAVGRYDLFGARAEVTRRLGALTLEGGATWNLTDRNAIDDRRLVYRLQLRRSF